MKIATLALAVLAFIEMAQPAGADAVFNGKDLSVVCVDKRTREPFIVICGTFVIAVEGTMIIWKTASYASTLLADAFKERLRQRREGFAVSPAALAFATAAHAEHDRLGALGPRAETAVSS
jgi:hypothetical protein